MSAETPREQEQVIGTLTGIVQKGADKFQAVVVPDGSQYSKNIWTKDQGLVATLSSMIGQRLAWLCNVSHWQMQDGTPVRSLWIEAVGPPVAGSPALAGPAQAASAPPPPQPVAQPAQQPWPTNAGQPPAQPPQHVVVQPQAQPMGQQVSQDVKEQRIHRQTASKVAAIMLTHVQPEERTMSTLLVLSERLVAYYNEGLPTLPPMDGQQTLDSEIQQAGGNLDALMAQAQPDDIPF